MSIGLFQAGTIVRCSHEHKHSIRHNKIWVCAESEFMSLEWSSAVVVTITRYYLKMNKKKCKIKTFCLNKTLP